MDLPTQNHLTPLRRLLDDRQRELQAEVQAAQAQQRALSGAGDHEVEDRKDEAAQQQLESVEDLQAQRDLDELAQVQSALRRLDEGSYGECQACGEPIAMQRLRVQPAALRCASCQARLEEGQARVPRPPR